MLSELIANETGLSRGFVEKLARTATYRYKIYTIPKRAGGERVIQHPSRQLKFLQRWLVSRVFKPIPIHVAATAYKSEASVRCNAEIHVSNNFLLRLDFKNFFPSIKTGDVERFLIENRNKIKLELGAEDLAFICNAVTRNGAIVIGAPSSPIISNQIMYPFDEVVSRFCFEKRVSYSRYADDMYFSTNEPNVLSDVYERVKQFILELGYPRLSLNQDKTSHSSRKRKRLVTGLSLTSDKKISLGRAKKRYVRSLVHKFINNQLEIEMRGYLAGYLSYAKSVEPSFIERLGAKFGQDAVGAAMRMPFED